MRAQWPGKSFWSPALGKPGGAALLISDKSRFEVSTWKKDSSGRIVSVLAFIDDLRFNFVHVYAPMNPTERKGFYENIHDFFCPNSFKILAGDFNCIESDLAVFWESVVGRPIFRWASVWRKSCLKLIENRKNDVLWLLLHNVVRVQNNSEQCAVCSRVESTKHCFVSCPRIVRVWNYFIPYLSRLLNSPLVLSFSSVIFPFINPSSSPGLPVFRYFLATILFCIWQARNFATFRNKNLNSRAIIDMVIKEIKLRIQCDPLDRVRYLWSINKVICQVDANDEISLNL